jgi:3',5'-cyclic AMP phosphodiesterase CpdA
VFRLAHFSDVHVTSSPWKEGTTGFAGKRLAGSLNYYVGGRRRHFEHVHTQLERLLDEVDGCDHGLCTGDLTQMSFESEFERCASLFGDRLRDRERWTVLPGNHDRYTVEAVRDRRFERWFGEVSSDTWPWVRQLTEGVTLVSVDVSRPCRLWDSSGWCGKEQRERLAATLRSPDLQDAFVVVALHYGLLRADGRPDRPNHGVRDYRELLAILDHPDSRVDLVVHGHLHRPFALSRRGYEIRCAGSATDLHRAAGYNIYRIDPDRRRYTVERRRWSSSDGRYQ